MPRGEALTAVLETEHPASGVPCGGLAIYEHLPQLITLDRSGYSPSFFAAVTPVAVRDGRPTDRTSIRAHL